MRLDHINVRTDDLESVKQAFTDILGLTEGARPPFPKPGHWLYGEGRPIVHLSSTDADAAGQSTGALDHIAFEDDDFDGLIGRLESAGIGYDLRTVPGSGVRQVFFHIACGIRIEVDFAPQAGGREA